MKVGVMVLLAFPAIYLVYYSVSARKYLVAVLVVLLYCSLGTVLYKRWQFYTVQDIELHDKYLNLTFLNQRKRILEYREIEKVNANPVSKRGYGLSIYTTSGERIETVVMDRDELVTLKAALKQKIAAP